MTVRELRDLLAAAERVSGLPWTLTRKGDRHPICGDGDHLVGIDAAILHPENAALLVAAVNALPALLDLAEGAADLREQEGET